MKATSKLDLYKLHKADYVAPKKPVLVRLHAATYLVIEGQGAPGGEEFTACIGALYGMAFTIKMTRKFAGMKDYAVCKLEGQWWADGTNSDFAKTPKDQWHWKLLIRTPEFITKKDLEKAAAALVKRGKGANVERVQLETLDEGPCVQMLHVGPYEKQCETIASMEAFAEKQQIRLQGPHHEIYLSDPRRVPPERLKTILRHPVKAT